MLPSWYSHISRNRKWSRVSSAEQLSPDRCEIVIEGEGRRNKEQKSVYCDAAWLAGCYFCCCCSLDCCSYGWNGRGEKLYATRRFSRRCSTFSACQPQHRPSLAGVRHCNEVGGWNSSWTAGFGKNRGAAVFFLRICSRLPETALATQVCTQICKYTHTHPSTFKGMWIYKQCKCS